MCRATCAAPLGQREAAVLPSGETGGNKVRSGGTLHARPAEILRDAGTGADAGTRKGMVDVSGAQMAQPGPAGESSFIYLLE